MRPITRGSGLLRSSLSKFAISDCVASTLVVSAWLNWTGLDVRHRGQLWQHRGVDDERVEPPPALEHRGGEPGDTVGLGDVDRRDRGRAALVEDLLLDRLERLGGARGEDDMEARARQRQRGRRADALARPRHQGDLPVGLARSRDPVDRQRQEIVLVAPGEVGEPGRVVAGEAGVADIAGTRSCAPASPTAR